MPSSATRSEVSEILKYLHHLLGSYQRGSRRFSHENVRDCSTLLGELGCIHPETLDAIMATPEGLKNSYRGDSKTRASKDGADTRFPSYEICSFSTSLAIAYDFAYGHKDSFLYSGRDIDRFEYTVDVSRFNEFVESNSISTVGRLSQAEDEIIVIGCRLRSFGPDEFVVGQSKNLHRQNPRSGRPAASEGWSDRALKTLAEIALCVPGIPPL